MTEGGQTLDWVLCTRNRLLPSLFFYFYFFFVKNHFYEKLFNLCVHVRINQTHSHIASFARGLVLKQRRKRQLFQVPVVFGACENFEEGTISTEISRESFQKIWNLSNFRKVNPSTENSGNSERKFKMEEKFLEEFFLKFRCTLQGCPLFLKFRKMLFHSSVEFSEIEPEFLSNGKRP